MSKLLNRRQFVKTSVAAAAAVGVSSLRANMLSPQREQHVEAIVVGSGFGGAVASLRLGEAGIDTLVLERGRRWPITHEGDTFCTKENPDGRAAWLSDMTILPAPITNSPINVFTGILDRKIGNGIIAYSGAGVGGGSLMYGGITLQPTRELFYRVFPRSLSYDDLDRTYFPRVRAKLNATPIPDDIFASDAYLSSRILFDQAKKAGMTVIKPDIAIDWNIVRQEIAGRKVPSIIAGEVFYGANSGAKNSLDRNYLSHAEQTGHVEIAPLHVVTSVEESSKGGYRVLANEISETGQVIANRSYTCRYLFLAAGSIGTPELLVRAKSNGTLRHLNDTVGRFWGTTSDSITVMVDGVLTNIALGSPGVIAIQDLNNPIAPCIFETFQALPLPQGVVGVLGQGISKPEGHFTYNRRTQSADLFWPANSADNERNTRAFAQVFNRLNQANGTVLAAPTDLSFTGHPLGGAVLGETCNNFGEVHGHDNLFVMDGSLIPGSAGGANPSLTIAALAEQSMDHFLNHGHKRDR